MTQAAANIVHTSMSITEIAMKYGYNSVEVFSRTFYRVWNVNPSEFKDHWSFTGIFPKINYQYKKGDDFDMAMKKFDISETYDYLKEHRSSYVICFDGKHFSLFNEVSRKAGDLAILEIASRIDRVATEDMLVLRIGGDEFALVTGLYDYDEVLSLANDVIKNNGRPIIYEGKELPLSLWYGITKIPENIRYSELFTDMHKTICESKLS